MTDKKINMRFGTPADNVLLAELGRRTFSDTFAKHNTPENTALYLAASFGPEIQAAKLADPNTFFIIAEIEGTPVGYAQLNLGARLPEVSGERTLEIERIYSDAAHIGKGVGAALMAASIDFAAEKGCDTIWLGVWEHNPRAIAFYTKWGFKTMGSHVFMLGEDVQNDFIMQRAVQA
jgi:GNAT superfamily N-acetyltransferase